MSNLLRVDLAAYRRNIENIKATMSPAKVMAVVKADAYGHGLLPIAKAAVEAGCELLGVLDIETGLELRKGGISTPAFAWLHSPNSDFKKAISSGIELSVSSMSELEAVSEAGRASIHLKVDTGLRRNGCPIEKWPELVTAAMKLHIAGAIRVTAVWSHLAGASKQADLDAISAFESAVSLARSNGFDGYPHIASSPAAFTIPESRFDMVRIGVSAFGTSPVSGISAEKYNLEAPMTLETEVIAPQVISIGFLHGLLSQLAGKTDAVIRGKRHRILEIGPLASRIAAGDYEIGETVTIFGEGASSAEELCELVGTVTDELFTGLKTDSVTYTN